MRAGYTEDQLVGNRAAVLLHGSTATERRAWAEEAAALLDGESCRVVDAPCALGPALANPRGVVFVPDLLGLGLESQAKLLWCLVSQEERPKLVLGTTFSPSTAVAQGKLRDDLAYRLSIAVVDLSTEAVREAVRARRQKADTRPQARSAPSAQARHPTTPAKKRTRT